MNELFKNKYRIPSARLQTWNYADNGMYFITICTANRECLFGNVVETINVVETRCIASLPPVVPNESIETEYKMELNDLGKIVEIEWLKTKELRPDMNLELDEFVVMPNHFHGIIYIGENQYNLDEYKNNQIGDTTQPAEDTRRDAPNHRGISTTAGNDIVNNYPNNSPKNKFGPQAKNLASIVRGFKSAVTTYARKNIIPFDWQSRFHDHIITTNKEYLRISDYIVNNPQNWYKDKFYVK